KNPESFEQWGTFITTPSISTSAATVNIKAGATGQNIALVTKVLDADGKVVATLKTTDIKNNQFEQNLTVPNPKLWSPETPYLYTAVKQLFAGNVLKDEEMTKFGIREIKYEANKGFSLNGKVTKFKGVCLHHDLGPLGAAVNKAALRRQMAILKDLG
ncbi:hypothetical protein QT869_22530, partial [Xanthomonas citri pv. citri]